MCKFSTSSNHHAVHQRSRDIQINRWSYDIAIDYRAERCPWLRNAWCEDCTFIDKDYRECALPKESKCRRATFSKKRPILTMKADLWSCTGSISSKPLRTEDYSLAAWLNPLLSHHQWKVCQIIRFSGGAHGIVARWSETCQDCCDHKTQERHVEESAFGCRHVVKKHKRAHVVVWKRFFCEWGTLLNRCWTSWNVDCLHVKPGGTRGHPPKPKTPDTWSNFVR